MRPPLRPHCHDYSKNKQQRTDGIGESGHTNFDAKIVDYDNHPVGVERCPVKKRPYPSTPRALYLSVRHIYPTGESDTTKNSRQRSATTWACLPAPLLPCSTLKHSSGKGDTKREASPSIISPELPENVTELADHGYIYIRARGRVPEQYYPLPLDFFFANKKICFFVNKKGVSVLRVERHSAVEEKRLVDQSADGRHSQAPVLDLLQLVPLTHIRRLRGQL